MNKPNLILDLDQTLISAEATEDIDENAFKGRESAFRHDDMDGYYTVYSRPHLQEFLDYAFENFNVTIWTAASKDYALFIIDKIVIDDRPERKLNYIFFSYHCDLSKNSNPSLKEGNKKYSKDLCMLWNKHNLPGFTEINTVIIDDYKSDVHKCQPNGCIIAPPFEATKKGSENDTFLKDLIPELDKMIVRMGNKDGDIATSVNNNMSV
jgi:TFIIF-interacting CTD phosphatase-like protein